MKIPKALRRQKKRTFALKGQGKANVLSLGKFVEELKRMNRTNRSIGTMEL